MSNSKVTKAEATGRTWSSDYGTFHDHAIEFENGDGGVYSSKSEQQSKFVVGQEAEYEKVPTKGTFPDKIKPVQQQQQGGGRGTSPEERRSITSAVAVNNTTQLVVGGMIEMNPAKFKATAKFLFDLLYELADGDKK